MPNKTNEIFDEVLNLWYQAEESCIHEYSTNFDNDYESLKKIYERYKKDYYNASKKERGDVNN